jgi:autotransporter translocation and assembly factor TamB
VGTVRDIGGRVVFEGRKAVLERGGATWNGQPVGISGWASIPFGEPWLAELRAVATNLTVVRSTEALIRADLDVVLARTNPAVAPGLSGTVTLRNSVVMLDVRDLVGLRNPERPEQRPPYFSVDSELLRDWGLDVRVHGSKFARVLSPAFRGTVSGDVRLLGTLGQPRVLGEGVVDKGQVVFPFGQLRVREGRIRFTEANPHRPQVRATAEGVNFGYAVTMDLDGTLDDPRIRMTTVPPMNTRAALQMLTAGTLPRGEYSFSGAARAQKVGAYLANDFVANLFGDPSEEPRLSVQSGQRVTAGGRLTYGVEYRLSERWSLVGEYDRWGQFNGGVRWRLLDR